MFLAIDIGNSNVNCGIFYKGKWIKIISIPSSLNFLKEFILLEKYKIINSAISSVVPSLTDIYIQYVKNLFNINALVIDYKNSGIKLNVNSPKEVGTDRICNVAAAIEMVGKPAIIGDIGSATNYDVVDHESAFIGGAISPGIKIAAQHLFEKAALLKKTALIVPESVIGRDTKTNLQSGIMFGAIDVIDGMLKRIQIETGWKKQNIIITGGFGELISSHLKTDHHLISTLTLDGIRLIHNKIINV